MASDPEDRFGGEREAFVLWLDRPRDDGPPGLRGTVERAATSERTRFESGEGLLRILAAALTSPGAESAAPARPQPNEEKER